MVFTLDNAAAYFIKNCAKDLERQFRNLILKHEPRVQRVFERQDRMVNMQYAWNLYLAVHNAPPGFHFLELGATDGTNLSQVEYFAQLWNKQALLTAIYDQNISPEKRIAAFEALNVSSTATWMENLDWPLLTDILLVHTSKHLNSCLWNLKLNGTLILHSDLWLNREFEGFEHLYEVGEYQVLRKIG
jgi:hypothetical protein